MSSRSVYVIDDDALVRSSMSALLSTFDLDVLEFESAESFLHWLPREPRGVVVTDLRMMGMSGLDLLEDLSERKCHMPVIVVTAHADVSLTVRLMQEGAVTVLEKPYGSEELRSTVVDALELESEMAHRSRRTSGAEQCLTTLTEGELDVLKLVREGQLNKEIAVELDISMRTVENRRSSIQKKMQVGSLAELLRVVGLTEQFAE